MVIKSRKLRQPGHVARWNKVGVLSKLRELNLPEKRFVAWVGNR